MGLCKDKSIDHLKALGLNVVLQPREGISPLMLIGQFKDSCALIGTLDQLVEAGEAALPSVASKAAADISGRRSSKLPVELGLNLLGNVIGAMGGNLGIKAAYEKARTVEFTYDNVTRHTANVIAIGDFLMGATIRWEHPILKKFLFGKGNLYVITEVVTAPTLKVTAFSRQKASIGVEIPVIQQIVGGSVSVGTEGEQSHTVAYTGTANLAFGFVAIELSAGDRDGDGEFDLIVSPVGAGGVAVGVGNITEPTPVMFGQLDTLETVDPATMGEPA